jgi:hypothetical protein
MTQRGGGRSQRVLVLTSVVSECGGGSSEVAEWERRERRGGFLAHRQIKALS